MSATPDHSTSSLHRPFCRMIYFCEEKLRYSKGIKAWIFLVPYLVGAVWLEPKLGFNGDIHSSMKSWLILLAYLLIFPAVWRAILLRVGLWKKRAVQ